jgi:hypothetical protein
VGACPTRSMHISSFGRDQHWRSRQTGVVAHASESVLCTRAHAIMLLLASHSRCTCNRHHHTMHTSAGSFDDVNTFPRAMCMQALTSLPFCSLQLASLEQALARAQCIRACGEPRCQKAALPSSCTVAFLRSKASMSRTGRRGGWCS